MMSKNYQPTQKHLENSANIVAHAIYDDLGQPISCVFCDFANGGNHSDDCPVSECLKHAKQHAYLYDLISEIKKLQTKREHQNLIATFEAHDSTLWAEWQKRCLDD